MTDTNAMDARHARSGAEPVPSRHAYVTPARPSPTRRPARDDDPAERERPAVSDARHTIRSGPPEAGPAPAARSPAEAQAVRPAPARPTPATRSAGPVSPARPAAAAGSVGGARQAGPPRPTPQDEDRSASSAAAVQPPDPAATRTLPSGGSVYSGPPDPGPVPHDRSVATGPLVAIPRLPPLPTGPPGVAVPLDHRSPVRYTGDAPADGWRGRVYTASRGRMNPGPSAAQLTRRRMINAIRRPLHEPRRVAVLSVKGGVGKTTVAACLGLVLAENRGDRIVALDANPDAGTLADRLTGVTSRTVRDLLDADPRSVTDLDRFTSLAGRLQVLASEQDPAAGEAFSRDEYERICAVLSRFTTVLITDSGTGLVHSAMEGTLALADSLVVVGSPTIDGADRAAKTLDWLAAHGQAALSDRALVVLSCDRWSREVDRDAIRAHFAARCRGVVEVPHDPYLAMGGRIQLPALRPPTLDAFLLLGALVIDGFAPAR